MRERSKDNAKQGDEPSAPVDEVIDSGWIPDVQPITYLVFGSCVVACHVFPFRWWQSNRTIAGTDFRTYLLLPRWLDTSNLVVWWSPDHFGVIYPSSAPRR